jgi:hypothetical protein
MRVGLCVFISGLLLAGTALAQSPLPAEQVCGPPSEQVSTTEKANLDAKAQTLLKIGSGELQGVIERVRNEIMVNPNRSDALREIMYLDHLSCVLIYQDSTLSTDEKLSRIRLIKSTLKLSLDARHRAQEAAMRARETSTRALQAADRARDAREVALEARDFAQKHPAQDKCEDIGTIEAVDLRGGASGFYQGEIHLCKPEGRGVFVNSEHEEEAGQWQAGALSGYGVQSFKDGRLFEGEFRNHQWYLGVMTFRKTGEQYAGEWSDDNPDGYGVRTWPRIVARYEGEEKGNLKSGYGIFQFQDGRLYEGQWRNDKRNGWGYLAGGPGNIVQMGFWTDSVLTIDER